MKRMKYESRISLHAIASQTQPLAVKKFLKNAKSFCRTCVSFQIVYKVTSTQ